MALLEIGFGKHKGVFFVDETAAAAAAAVDFLSLLTLEEPQNIQLYFFCFIVPPLLYWKPWILDNNTDIQSKKISGVFFSSNYTGCMGSFEAGTNTNISIKILACLHGSNTFPKLPIIPSLEGIPSFRTNNDSNRYYHDLQCTLFRKIAMDFKWRKNDTMSLSTEVHSRLTIKYIQIEIKEATLQKNHHSGTNKH